MSVSRVCMTLGCCLAALYAAGGAVFAQFQVATLGGANVGPGEEFGHAIAIDGDVMVASAPGDDVAFANSGSVFVFRRLGDFWTPEAQLVPSDAKADDYFGWSVAVRGNLLAVGAPGNDDAGSSAGTVYLFEFVGGSWVEGVKLRGGDTDAGDGFGGSVAFGSQDLLVAGATENFVDSLGAVYVLRWNGVSWVEEGKLTRPTNFGNAGFARTVATNGDRVVVGAPWDDAFGPAAGAAYVYQAVAGGWGFESALLPADLQPGDEFGTAMAMDGDAVVVSAPRDDSTGLDHGSAYLFQFQGNTWVQGENFVAWDDMPRPRLYGWSVALAEGMVLIGAPGDNDACPDFPLFCPCASGAVYSYVRTASGWRQLAKINAFPLVQGDEFGVAVAIGNGYAVASARELLHLIQGHCDLTSAGPGAAHVFRIVPPIHGDVNRDGVVDADDFLCLLDTYAASVFPIACLSPNLITVQFVSFADKDIAPCPGLGGPLEVGDGFVNVDDVLAALDRFAGIPPTSKCAGLFP